MLYCATLRVIRFIRRCLMGVITKTAILHHAVVCRVAALPHKRELGYNLLLQKTKKKQT